MREKSAEMLGNRNLSNFAYCLNSNGSRYKLNPKVSKSTTRERQIQSNSNGNGNGTLIIIEARKQQRMALAAEVDALFMFYDDVDL